MTCINFVRQIMNPKKAKNQMEKQKKYDKVFIAAMNKVFEHEGGFSDDPRDNGGTTNLGVSLMFAKSIKLDLNKDGKTDAADIKLIDTNTALDLYYEHFWLKASCHALRPEVAIFHFDVAVNMGVSAAIRLLQRAAKVSVDGVIGKQTVMATFSRGTEEILTEYATHRMIRYSSLDDWPTYRVGWTRRTFDMLLYSMSYKEA